MIKTKILEKNLTLAESPIFCNRSNKLYWVDIKKKIVFNFDLKSKKKNKYNFTDIPSAVFLTANPKWIGIVTNKNILITNFKKKLILTKLKLRKKVRTNDSKIDKNGNLVFSTMQENKKNKGAIFKFIFKKDKIKLLFKNLTIPNSISFNKKNFYFSDSAKGIIYKNDKKNYMINSHLIEPDGATITQDNKIIFADYKNAELKIVYNNKILDKIKLPCKNPTSLCFFGKKLNYICVTSHNNKNKKKNKYDGSVFTFKSDLIGKIENFADV